MGSTKYWQGTQRLYSQNCETPVYQKCKETTKELGKVRGNEKDNNNEEKSNETTKKTCEGFCMKQKWQVSFYINNFQIFNGFPHFFVINCEKVRKLEH